MSSQLRLWGTLVDVPRAEHERTVAFWAGALGVTPQVSERFPDYAQFGEVTPGVYFVVQATADQTRRIHLDFESEDVEADVARLAALGATEIGRSHHWVVMQDPAGVTFCIVAAVPAA